MGIFTLTVGSYTNLSPSQIGNISLNLTYNQTYTFTIDDFTTNTTPPYMDPEGDSVETVKIITIPTQGVLELSAVAVIALDEITLADINAGNLKYIADVADTDGYSNSELTFDIADDGSSTYSGLTGIVTFNVGSQANAAPVIGDGASAVNYGEALVFTSAMFTTGTTPAYSDAEGDPASQLKILTLPTLGIIQYNGINVVVNQIINFSDIDLGLLTFIPDLADTNGDVQNFTYAISDTGSGIFST
jgi:hypothetical protein